MTSTIDNMNSGFVHGAAVHTMDIFDGCRFAKPTTTDDLRLADMRETFPMYIQPALMDVATAAMALGAETEFQMPYKLTTELFHDNGDVKWWRSQRVGPDAIRHLDPRVHNHGKIAWLGRNRK